MPDRTADLSTVVGDACRAARDTAYVAIGAGVLGFQRVQVHRHELGKRLAKARAAMEDGAGFPGAGPAPSDGPAAGGRPGPEHTSGDRPAPPRGVDGLAAGVLGTVQAVDRVVDDAVESVVTFVESVVGPVEDRLPDPARTVAHQAHAAARQFHVHARDVRSQLVDRIAGLGS